MSTWDLESLLLRGLFGLAPIVFLVLWFIDAPYGRHQRPGWGPSIDNRFGWILMESPSCLVFLWTLRGLDGFSFVLLPVLLWSSHYVHRAFIYPFGLRRRPMPLSIVAMGIGFNLANAYLNGAWLARHAAGYDLRWLQTPACILGCALFCTGYVINRRADAMLRDLPRTHTSGYSIPQGFLYRWVSCPNYLGELIQWFGWALLVWSPPGLMFAIWTAANLAPRARAHHRWYKEQFEDYPRARRALIPLLF